MIVVPGAKREGARTPRAASAHGCARGGFSLLELLVVLALVTGLATFSVWAFFSRGEVTLDNAAELLVEDLHLAQSRALYLRTPVSVHFDDDGHGYGVSDGSGEKTGIEALDVLGRRYDTDAVFDGVSVVDVRGPAGRNVRFDAKGHVAGTTWITLGYRGESRTVRLEEAPGAIFVVDAAR